MLQASVMRGDRRITSYYGLNDAVLKVVSLSRIVNFRLYANDELVEEYPGDGILISTPTGSTGYSLSNGGPIVMPEFELLLMSPICTHKFNARPMIFKADDLLKVQCIQENTYVKSRVVLTVDGQVGFQLKEEDEVVIKAAPNPIKLLEVFPQDFYSLIRTKID
jgi:NAD+ kinase